MLTKIFPFLSWLKGYNSGSFRADFISGLTVALVLIPQSMAYAQLAGMPSYYGLYAAFLPPMIAALFGSSRQLATGPVAVVSLMTAASLAPLATAGSEGYIGYALLLSLIVGVFQFLLGVLRLGLVVNFLSHPVVNGFTNAGAIIIATSQLEKMFGVYVDGKAHHYETIIEVCKSALHYTHWPTLVFGVGAFTLMFVLKKMAPKVPNVLVAVVLTTVIAWATGFQHDTTAAIDTIQSPKAREMIVAFNAAMEAKPALEKKQTDVALILDEAKKAHDNMATLDAEHESNRIQLEIKEISYKASEYRKELRDLLFQAVPADNGSLSFHLAGELPDGVEDDGRTWRIKVGNSPLKTAELKMMGGGAVVGDIPKGLPSLSMPAIDMRAISHLLASAIIISLLGFMEAISIAKAMAAKTGQRLDPNQELIGQGLANILGSMSNAYPVSGSFSRSAVNLQSGAVTGLSSLFTSATVALVLLFFTPLLYHLPQSVLAAVIMMAVIGLINASGFIHAWKAKRYDGIISVISFLMTLAFAPHLDKGIMIGVGLSLAVFLYKSMRPTVTSLSRFEDESLRDSVVHGLRQCQYIDMIRFDGPLFFANASYLEDQISARMENKKDLRHIVIVANGMNDIDASGEEVLSLVVANVRSAGMDISFSGVNETVMEVLERTHLIEKIGRDHVYSTMEKAICAVHESAHRKSEESQCPLTNVCYIA
ncbi:STAS domain-containing protein [Desulfoprunum benzoelyticum]|uniref:MFS superfamily sulfate permease-like transporter n=1 Tax=Desulfoprunum benzoelyticum TaxID=1506996 RepID=A0A840UZH5_9BACT|nr:SulP family inorganic anion transporter [Desulfoprunum benzoelyticum]MBB5348854.1 MFS superfamily sulfate permease-like transporter [Desulfoprunum benzoelyticum]MBM9530094.1 STAS domain-containing protein [Desulfoprunum benzoelyticum]